LHHPEKESHPAIVVHIADDKEIEVEEKITSKPKILQTKCPERPEN